jgi:hypothetical protein
MKTNKYLLKLTFLSLTVLLIFAASADAQRKKTTRKTTPTKTTTTTTTTNALEIKQNADKVSIQIKNVTKFLYVLGGAANGLEIADKEAKAGKLSREAVDKNNQYKQNFIASIRNLKAGLADLEIQFRTKPSIKLYLVQIQGVTDLATQSEDLAAAGRFTDSGKPFLMVIEKLADTLAAMP